MSFHAESITTKDAFEGIELFYQKGWTDGLPIIPPPEDRIQSITIEEKVEMSLVVYNPTSGHAARTIAMALRHPTAYRITLLRSSPTPLTQPKLKGCRNGQIRPWIVNLHLCVNDEAMNHRNR